MSKQKKQPIKTSTRPVQLLEPMKGFPDWFSTRKYHIWGLFILCFLLYANSIPNDYALDDAIVITDNMYTSDGLKGIPGILSKDTFFGFFKEEGKANLVAGGRYRPLSLVTFALEVQLFGKKPGLSHLVNALLYGLTTVMLYLLLMQFFRSGQSESRAYFLALATCVIFAVHPVHTEVVANIKGRDEILALLGSLAALYYCFRAWYEKKTLYWVYAMLLFFGALLSKENAITFLAVTPLAFYFFTNIKLPKIITPTALLLAAALVFLGIRFSILGSGSAEPVREMMNNPFIKVVGNQYLPFSTGERLATVLFSLGKYLELLVFPWRLTHDYYPRQIGVMTFGDWQVVLSTLLYLAMGIYALLRLPKKDPMSFAILFYLITLSIGSNLFFPIGTHMAERLIFMPSIGFSIAVALLLYRWARGSKKNIPAYKNYQKALWVLGLVALLFSIRTMVRNPVWKDNLTLFTTDIQYSPNSAKLRNAVGGELSVQSLKESDPVKKQQMLQEAAGHLQEAIRIHPNYKNAYLILGNVQNYLKNYEASIAAYEKALELDPLYQDAKRNLGITYKEYGQYWGEQKNDLSKAIANLRKAYDMIPTEYDVVRLLGVAYGRNRQGQEAVEFFTKATELAPDNADAWFNLGTAHHALGNTALGNQYYEKAKAIDPSVETRMRN